tara:strand:+ start:2383 stop:2697 length:315 start_codon:yes stop_codon:yes gene_type:complete
MINRENLINNKENYIGKDVVFKSPTRFSNEKAKRKLQSVDVVAKYDYENDITKTYFYGVKVRYGGGSFTVSPHEIISIDGQQFDEYDKDNYSTLIGAYKNRLGL